jgi:hypothetical protein
MRAFIFNSYGEESFGDKLFEGTNITPNTIINGCVCKTYFVIEQESFFFK